MNIGIATLHNLYYKDLAYYTYDNNLVEYAKRHSYNIACKQDNFSTDYLIYFEKIKFILDTFKDNPDLDWIWWLDCDAMVTNYTIKLENIIDNDYDVIMSTDFNGLNCGSFLVKNSNKGKAWLEMIFSQRYVYKFYSHSWPEQLIIMETARNYTEILKVVPQKTFNSYYYSLYGSNYGHDGSGLDRLGISGNWQPGDFVIHFPGYPNDQRIEWIKTFSDNAVIK
jgi:hypothetical protein